MVTVDVSKRRKLGCDLLKPQRAAVPASQGGSAALSKLT
jgi:hypothetical protein